MDAFKNNNGKWMLALINMDNFESSDVIKKFVVLINSNSIILLESGYSNCVII